MPLHLVRVEHIEQGVVERTEIGVDLLLQRARQKAETFAGLDGRPRQDDARDTFLRAARAMPMATARYVLPVPAGPIPKTMSLCLDRLEVLALVHRLRRDQLLAEIALPAALDQPAGGSPRGRTSRRAGSCSGRRCELLAFEQERDIIAQNALGPQYAGVVAFNFKGIIQQTGRTFRPCSRRCIFSSRVPNKDLIPRLISTQVFMRWEKNYLRRIQLRGGRSARAEAGSPFTWSIPEPAPMTQRT